MIFIEDIKKCAICQTRGVFFCQIHTPLIKREADLANGIIEGEFQVVDVESSKQLLFHNPSEPSDS